jgi:hypothetical protein
MASSVLDGFRPALDMLRSGEYVKLADNHLQELFLSFEKDKRFIHLFDDAKVELNGMDDTLLDAEKQLEAVQTLQGIIDQLSALKRDIMVRHDTIIEDHVSRGIMESDGFRIEPTFGNREIDVSKVKRQKEWQSFLEMRKENLESEIRLNQGDLKAMFKKQYEAFLKPGKINGYKLVPGIPEKGGDVEC